MGGGRYQHLPLVRGLLLVGLLSLPGPAAARVTFEPSVESRTVFNYSSDQDPEKRAWNEIGAGIDTSIERRRIDFDLRYRYGHRIAITGPATDKSRHNGSGVLRTEVLSDLLFLDAQANATILNTQRGGVVDPDGDDSSQQQTFGASIQPSLRHRFGRTQVTARYSYGIFEVDRADLPRPLRIGQPIEPGSGFQSGASNTRNQSASVNIGNVGRSDRLRWRLTGEYQRDAIEQLDQRFTSKRIGGDGEYAVSRTIGLIANVGYEDILDRQDALLIDFATGLPVPDAQGRAQRDPSVLYTTNFDVEGVTYEGGFRLSPSRRTSLIMRAGKRFGDFTASASAQVELAGNIQLLATYTESLNNFGRLFTTLFTDPVSGVVTPIGSFAANGQNSPLGSSSCAFGLDAQTGSCQFNLTQVATSATFKDQAGAITLARGMGGSGGGSGDGAVQISQPRFSGSVSGFFNRRSYLGGQPPGLPPGTPASSLGGGTDTSYGFDLRGQQRLGAQRTAGFSVRAQRNEYGLSRDSRDLFVSAQTNFTMLIGRSMSLFANAFASWRRVDDRDGAPDPLAPRVDLGNGRTFSASIGLRYQFSPNRGRGSQASSTRRAEDVTEE
ncbi:hypothetical protein ACFOMD_14805 [Sphingoaurantiacus capsulatus]|uniref:TIGR03016 family PEP-CTERM system-associated outer membrane protein n=1 Tax=Sphingoaurantiacus capsulatus TaxID=1771310 RepID=A0ABV7XEY8_9SPHN